MNLTNKISKRPYHFRKNETIVMRYIFMDLFSAHYVHLT